MTPTPASPTPTPQAGYRPMGYPSKPGATPPRHPVGAVAKILAGAVPPTAIELVEARLGLQRVWRIIALNWAAELVAVFRKLPATQDSVGEALLPICDKDHWLVGVFRNCIEDLKQIKPAPPQKSPPPPKDWRTLNFKAPDATRLAMPPPERLVREFLEWRTSLQFEDERVLASLRSVLDDRGDSIVGTAFGHAQKVHTAAILAMQAVQRELPKLDKVK